MPRPHTSIAVAILRRSTLIARRELRCIMALLLVLTLVGLFPNGVSAAAGDLDPTFGTGGKKTTDFMGN